MRETSGMNLDLDVDVDLDLAGVYWGRDRADAQAVP